MINRGNVQMELEIIERDETAKGWDLPARFVIADGPETNPHITTMVINPEDFPHPGMYISTLLDSKVVFPPSVLGIGLVCEGYSHLPFDEAIEAEGHMVHDMWQQALKDKHQLADEPLPDGVETIEEALRQALKNVWERYQFAYRPGTMPDHLRRENRTLNIIFRTGEEVDMIRFRDGALMTNWNDVEEDAPDGALQVAIKKLLGLV